jgi:hypothetical protein
MLRQEGLGEAWISGGQHRDVLVSAEVEGQGGGRGCLS